MPNRTGSRTLSILRTTDGVARTLERLGFQRMMAELEKNNIDAIIIKDMSRIGHNWNNP